MKPRAELDAELDALAEWVPVMLAETDDVSQMDAFASRADLIYEAAPVGADRMHVRNRLQRILVDNCMVPADEGPCED
jgi:hypothetical protein